MVEIAKLAKTVDDAARKARAIPQLSDKTKYSLDDAYDIQAAAIQRRLDRGEKRNGMKMGFTSRAKMIQMGLNDMIWGRLTDRMVVEDGGTISLKNYVHPRVEPEIAFLLKRPLGYPCTAADAHMRGFIAGASTTGPVCASAASVSTESASPWASLASVFAVSGATASTSARVR